MRLRKTRRDWRENCQLLNSERGKETDFIFLWLYKYYTADKSMSAASVWNPTAIKKPYRWNINGNCHNTLHCCVLSWAQWNLIEKNDKINHNLARLVICSIVYQPSILHVYCIKFSQLVIFWDVLGLFQITVRVEYFALLMPLRRGPFTNNGNEDCFVHMEHNRKSK